MGTTPTLELPYPELDDTADVPRDIKALADAVDAQSLLPAGVIQMWPGTTPPDGWLLLDGTAAAPAASNPQLAAMFGTSGANVALPNLAGRTLIGAKATGTVVDPARALKSTGGASLVQLSARESGIRNHTHDDTMAVGDKAAFNTNNGGVDHSHGYTAPGGTALVIGSPSGSALARAGVGAATGGASAYVHAHTVPQHGHALNGTVTNVAGTNKDAQALDYHENMPPYYAINFIIRAG